MWRWTPPSNVCSEARSASCAWSASARGTRSTRKSPPASPTCRGDPRLGRARLGVGRDALLRAGPRLLLEGEALDPRARGDGQLRRSDVTVSGGSLHRRRGAGRSGGAALPNGRGRRRSASASGACPRPRAGRGPPRIWQKPGPLNAGEWEQVRLHPYYTERVLARSEFLATLARLPEPTTSASTAPGTTAEPPARTSLFQHACSPRATPTTR